MDSFINLAKQGYAAYQESHSDVRKTGGSGYNTPHHSGQDGSMKEEEHGPKFDKDEVVRTASAHGSGDSDLFSTALNFLNSHKQKHGEPVDEEQVIKDHKKAYEDDDTGNMSARSLGGAAALQVFKQFTSGSHSKSEKGGNMQTELISMAMAEATKLFDKSGGKASGDKQEAVNGAAMMVMKLLFQSKFGHGHVGGSNSGGLSGLLSLAQKFT